MTFQKFVAQLPDDLRTRRSEETLKIWHVIHKRIVSRGQTCRYDQKLVSEADKVKVLSGEALQGHLRTLQQAGILQGTKIARQVSPMESLLGLGGIIGGIFGDPRKPPPGAFVAYTFPGMRVDTDALAKLLSDQSSKASHPHPPGER